MMNGERIKFSAEDQQRVTENVPPELKECEQWVAFKTTKKDKNGKLKKEPIDPNSGDLAKTTDPDTWSSLGQACSCANETYRGVGFVFSKNDPYVGIDLDNCIENGRANHWTQTIVDKMDSYTEVSLNGGGLHIIGRGHVPDKRRKKGRVEMYHTGRYFAMTGNVYDDHRELRDIQPNLNIFYKEVFGEKKTVPKKSTVATEKMGNGLSDAEVVTRASKAKNGDRFKALWYGDWKNNYASQSEADLALCSMLAFWTNRDAESMDRLFRESELMREKWDAKRGEMTYGEMTIAKAIS